MSYYGYKSKGQLKAEEKNRKLVRSLMDKRENFCGIGTRKVKLLLNKKVKEGDKLAELYRTALEIEDQNIQAKKAYGKYRQKIYDVKYFYIEKLVSLCKECNIVYGIQESDVMDTGSIVYFELPDCEQISFHCTFKNPKELPRYEKEWDGKVNSTLGKLETAISKNYGNEIEKKKEK